MKKFNKKGLTLVELILTIALSLIVVSAIGVAISNFGSQYIMVSKRQSAKTVATEISQRIETQLRFASKAHVSNTPSGAHTSNLTSTDGRLYLKKDATSPKTMVMDEKAYLNLNCNVSFIYENENCVTIEIVVYSGAVTKPPTDENYEEPTEVKYRLTRTIKLLNTNDNKLIIEGNVVSHEKDVTRSHILSYTN